ncbi:MAG: OsmC family protein [Bacteroidetes bacterium]|nr:OsmC family protein [Bacteroidota bacterium]MCL6101452.1 OsmC family protein [Bacteroidota bacterium]
MKQEINLSWKKGMAFETELFGHKLTIDADQSNGGQNLGPRPKPLLMVALAGCTGMDVVSILEKMRVELADLNVRVEGEVTEEHPKQFTSLHIIYEFWGKDLPMEKLEKAVSLSDERYCGVSATLKKGIPVTHEIVVHDR